VADSFAMSFTVVPIHNLDLPAGTCIPFGDGFVLQDVPDWVKSDSHILADINRNDRDLTLDAKHAFVAEYEAEAIGQPDPNWKGKNPKGIQDLKFQSAMLANLAIWLRQPAPISFTVCFHALSRVVPDQEEKVPIILHVNSHPPLYCHPKDAENIVTANHVVKAGELHSVLATIPRKNPVWEALRAIWAALTMYPPDHRYPFFWMALEALFGTDDTGETTYKLCQRIAFFLADSPDVARDLFKKTKTCYNTRSKIIHGRWKDDPKIEVVMADTEAIARTALRHLLDNPDMLKTFISKKRDKFLEDWVFSRSMDPPPYPTTS
jgi:hypothetical protein